MNIEQIKTFLEGTTKCRETSGSEVFQFQDKGSMVLFPTSLQEGKRGEGEGGPREKEGQGGRRGEGGGRKKVIKLGGDEGWLS